MTLDDIRTEVRTLLAESDPSGRWADSDLAGLINEAQTAVALRIRWPEATWVLNVPSGGYHEFQMPENVLEPLRVYVAGQPLPRVTINALEGISLGVYDQSGANHTPLWTQQAQTVYPVATAQFSPVVLGVPYFAGQQPVYYTRGGSIGFVPAPATGQTVQLDGIPTPVPLVSSGDKSLFPVTLKALIAWKAVELCLFADRDRVGTQLAAANVEREFVEAYRWKAGFTGERVRAPIIRTFRSRFFGPPKFPTGRANRIG